MGNYIVSRRSCLSQVLFVYLFGLLVFVLSFSAFGQEKPLSADLAFPLHFNVLNDHQVDFIWTLPEGYFLYKDKIKFHIESPSTVNIQQVNYPLGVDLVVAEGHSAHVYQGTVTIPVNISSSKRGVVGFNVSFQGCTASYCYPPQSKHIKVQLPLGHLSGETASFFTKQPFYWVWILFLGGGILLCFTPCVFPTIPLLASLILGGGRVSGRRGLGLSGSYVLGMACVYVLIGVSVSYLGQNVQLFFQTPSVMVVFGVALLFFALTLFDVSFFNWVTHRFRSWFSRLSIVLPSIQGGGYVGAFLLGVTANLILSPCVTAPFAAALVYIAQQGDLLFGAGALFFLAVGVGLPLILVSTLGARFLPKSGAWLLIAKRISGVLLLGLAVWFVQPLCSPWQQIILWAGAGFLTLLLLLRHRLKKRYQVLLISLLLEVIAVSVISVEHYDFFSFSHHHTAEPALLWHTVQQEKALNQQLSDAENVRQPVLIVFYAAWCPSCQVMEKTTFVDQAITPYLSSMRLVRVDVTNSTPATRALLQRFQLFGPPALVLIASNGQRLKTHAGFMGADSLLKWLEKNNSRS